MGKMKKRLAVIGTVTTLAIGGGFAWAAWNADGSGTAAANAGTAVALSVTGAAVDGALVPNAPAKGLALTISNSNKYDVKITKLALTKIDVTATLPGGNGCTGAGDGNATLTSSGTTGIVLESGSFEMTLAEPITVPKESSPTVSIPAAVKMTNESVNDCQGDTFQLGFKVTGESAA